MFYKTGNPFICRAGRIAHATLPKYVADEKGNIVPTAGFEPTARDFWTSVLTILPPRL